ncbi:MAG TPA: hypothetical protein DCZ94_18850 [Lentisphaeria bacterium]|nr:MAG: hypothetical protein A2X48_22045 [Lentisphaerae bacterium GWF2_49_21]HBC89003.1 hypothetical protein [Lentisphaeria bacterium]
MARFVNIATIHFQVSENLEERTRESAYAQLAEAAAMLNGTGVDLVVTCEGMESVGQTMDQAENVSSPGPLLRAYQAIAEANHCTVAGSIKLEDGGKVYNALAFIGPDGGVLGDYRKTFPTTGELKKGIQPGSGAKVVETPAGRLGGAICYDLKFDDLRDQYQHLCPDVLCFSSMFHGAHTQANWAFQCRCFFAAACKDISSDILSPLGHNLASTSYYGRIARARVNLDRFITGDGGYYAELSDIYRKYRNEVVIEKDLGLGVSVLYSQSDRRSAAEIAKEFGLVDIDEQFLAYRSMLRQRQERL